MEFKNPFNMNQSSKKTPTITLRRGRPEDAAVCGPICYQAFKTISEAHNFPPDIPSPEMATGFLSHLLSNPAAYSVVAELDGRVVGSNFLWEFQPIAGIGPITVDPAAQNGSVGRRLMEDALARCKTQHVAGVRLVQAAFHNRSLSLYTKLGFNVCEPLTVLQGPVLNVKIAGYDVRPAKEADLVACNRVCFKVHGHDRGMEVQDAVRKGTATVVEHAGRITGYATVVGFFGHAVGETNEDVQALIGAAKEFAGPGFLLPTRNGELFRWCLKAGLRVVQPMTLMSIGLYNEPKGAFLSSILF